VIHQPRKGWYPRLDRPAVTQLFRAKSIVRTALKMDQTDCVPPQLPFTLKMELYPIYKTICRVASLCFLETLGQRTACRNEVVYRH